MALGLYLASGVRVSKPSSCKLSCLFWGGWRWCPYLTSMPLPLKSLKWCIQGAHDKRRQMNPLYGVKLREFGSDSSLAWDFQRLA